jgi:hypothetical protein
VPPPSVRPGPRTVGFCGGTLAGFDVFWGRGAEDVGWSSSKTACDPQQLPMVEVADAADCVAMVSLSVSRANGGDMIMSRFGVFMPLFTDK